MKTRIISLFLAILMLCALLPQVSPAVSADTATSGKCGDKLNWSYDTKTHKLTITGSGATYDFDDWDLKQPWIKYREEIASLSLPEGLTRIGYGAFGGLTALESVSFPKTLKEIGAFSFDLCKSLTSVSFPEGLKKIEDYAFESCKKLEKIHFPDSLEYIGECAFYECVKLKEVTLPKNLKTLRGMAFNACPELKRVVIQGNQAYQYLYWIRLWPDENVYMPPADFTKYNEYNDMLGDHTKVEVYGYPTGAEGEMRTETLKVKDFEGKTSNVKGKWAQYVCDYAKADGYKFFELGKFSDVKSGDPCEIPVAWAVANKVTAGMDKTHFAPTQTVTRAQAMTFFWAAQNKPKFKKANTQFVDVKKTDWFYKSVMWAVENGVTAGTDAMHFSPNKTCNRGEILAFLYAALKKPKVSIKNPYKDVSNQWYKKAALWAYANGIEKGKSGKFNASTPCTRASTVTYLYRFKTGCGLAE